jgi:hypothetical protein
MAENRTGERAQRLASLALFSLTKISPPVRASHSWRSSPLHLDCQQATQVITP